MSKITEIKQKQQDGSYKSFNISADTIVGLKNPDWNQNDDTAADYIKNRTHYIDGEENVTLVDKTLEEDDWNDGITFDLLEFNQSTPIKLTAGYPVYIDFNNSGTKTEYIIKAYQGQLYCGNPSLAFPYDDIEEDTGEDFGVRFFEKGE